MRLFGLIGYPLGHSFSKKYFSEKFAREGIADARYELFPLENIRDLPALLRAQTSLRGLNVTIPYKKTVLPYLDELDETARAVGAVNCISIQENKLKGYNTDVYGFEKTLESWLPDPLAAKALVLGTGGASKAVAFVLKKHGIPFQFVSRRPEGPDEISYDALHKVSKHLDTCSLLVNTTPLGTFPYTDTCPDLPFERLSPEHSVYDLVYNPPETLLLRQALARGCRVKNGLDMLVQQAEKAWENWIGGA